MRRRRSHVAGIVLVLLAMAAIPASAQVVTSIHVGAGGFFPRGLDSRASGDVLVRDITGKPIGDGSVTDALAVEVADFKSGQAFAEFNLGFGPHVELGAGVSGFGRHVPSLYRDLVDDSNNDIEQTLTLRAAPITVLARFLPFGDFASVQPYVGAGFAIVPFRYSEIGDFVDSNTLVVFSDRYVVRKTAPGAVLVGGVRFPLRGDIYALSVEGRYLRAVGDTGGTANGFLSDKIDLSGGMLNVGFIVRF
jgi:hypothetical protein